MIKSNGQDEEAKKSNITSKLFIILVFFIAITFAVLAVVMQMQNQKREMEILETSWKADKRPTVTVADFSSVDTLAEKVGVAKNLSNVVRTWRVNKITGNIHDDRKDMSMMENHIADILNSLNITVGYQLTKDYEKMYVAPKNASKSVLKTAKYFKQEGVSVKIKSITREKLIQFLMAVEDSYPFAKAYYVKLYRDKGDDKGESDNWKADVKFIWFKKKADSPKATTTLK